MIDRPTSLYPRLLLYLSAAGASCAVHRLGGLKEVRALPAGEEGWELFNRLLLQHPGIPVAIAVDTVDELYRQDQLPRVHGRDRREMTERRLRQLIHHSPYRAALRQDRLKDDSRRDRYLMMGLTDPEIIAPWLDILHVRGSYLAGIWLLPALATGLARRLRLTRSRLLLVSEQTGGLRLTYIEDGELRFSRLAPVDGSPYDNPLESYAEEIERTRQALVGQRLLARTERLRTVLLDPLNTLADLHTFLPESAGFQCESIPRGQLLDTLRLPPSLLAESADALYLRLLPDAPASANLMTRDQRDLARTRWLGRALRHAALGWLAFSTLACAGLWLDGWRLDARSAELLQAAESQRAQERTLLTPAGGVSAVHRRLGALAAWQAVSDRDQAAGPAFRVALAAAAATGNIQLRRLSWSSRGTDGSDGPLLVMEGEISPFDGQFQHAQQRVDGLRSRMRQLMPGSRVEVPLWPLDAAPEHGLEGEFGHSRLNARFRVEAKGRP
jgi:hypothetical protein